MQMAGRQEGGCLACRKPLHSSQLSRDCLRNSLPSAAKQPGVLANTRHGPNPHSYKGVGLQGDKRTKKGSHGLPNSSECTLALICISSASSPSPIPSSQNDTSWLLRSGTAEIMASYPSLAYQVFTLGSFESLRYIQGSFSILVN